MERRFFMDLRALRAFMAFLAGAFLAAFFIARFIAMVDVLLFANKLVPSVWLRDISWLPQPFSWLYKTSFNNCSPPAQKNNTRLHVEILHGIAFLMRVLQDGSWCTTLQQMQ